MTDLILLGVMVGVLVMSIMYPSGKESGLIGRFGYGEDTLGRGVVTMSSKQSIAGVLIGVPVCILIGSMGIPSEMKGFLFGGLGIFLVVVFVSWFISRSYHSQ